MSTPTSFLERLHRAAAQTRDLVEYAGADRWEFFAKASYTREVEVKTGGGLVVSHAEEMGVAVRTRRRRSSGFAAASGLEADAPRRAVDGALASELDAESDPLPPRRLLAAVAHPDPPPLPPEGWASHAADELARSMAASFGERLNLSRCVVQEGAYGWVLTTGDGFVAAHLATACSIAVATRAGQSAMIWNDLRLLTDPESFDAESLVAGIGNRALLTLAEPMSDSGLKDVLLHPEVTAHFLAGLLPLFCSTSPETDPLPQLLDRSGLLTSPVLSLADDRTDRSAPTGGPCDGEGLPSRRILLLERGVPRHRLACYRDAVVHGETPRGGAVRYSYRDYPETGAANLVVDVTEGDNPGELLARTDRVLYLLRPMAAVAVNTADDTYRLLATGVWLHRGRVMGLQPVVELRGSLGHLLRRIEAVGTDLSWHQTAAGLVAAPSLLIRRQPIVS